MSAASARLRLHRDDMTTPAATTQALLFALSEKSYKTYLARLRASKRLAARNRAWNTSLIATAAASTIASVALLSDET
ncbi:MAG: hypothetical protein JWN08_1292, partial [Frankiales bacterium]|nr:hypothetical protein [Frankiales bacterium]